MNEVLTSAPHDKLMADIKEKIVEHGWAVIGTATMSGTPFAYTVGLWKTFGHAEVLVVGLSGDVAKTVLNNVGERIRSRDRFKLGYFYVGIIEKFDVKFLDVVDHECIALGVRDHLEKWAPSIILRRGNPGLQAGEEAPPRTALPRSA